MIEFEIDSNKIAFSDKMILYNEIRLYYKDLALECKDIFTEKYKEKYKTLEQLCKDSEDNGLVLGANIIKVALDKTIDLLVELGYIDIDLDYFFNNYYNEYYTWEEDFEEIREQYLKFVLDQKMMDEYRVQRRLNRGRLVGGGFGVKGATKGMVMAGLGNTVLGGAHMMVNGIEKFISECKDYSKMNDIFKNPKTLNFLSDSIEQCVFNIHFAYVKFIMDNSTTPINIISEHDVRKSTNMYNNLKHKLSTKEELITLFKNILNINPYFEPIYFTYIDRFGDENKQVELIGQYFGLDIKKYKFTLLKDFYDSSLLECIDEESSIILKEKINQMIKRLGYEEDKFDTQLLDNKIQEFDTIARTYKGILFKSREEAQKAQEEYEKIINIIKSHPIHSIEDFLLIINRIKGQYETIIGDKIITELEILSRTVNEIVYDTFDDAMLAEKTLKTIDLNSLNSIKQCIYELEAKEDLNTKLINYLKLEYDRLDREYRTVGGIVVDSMELAKEIAPIEKQFQDNLTSLDNIDALNKYRETIKSQTYLESLKNIHLKKIDSKINLLKEERKRKFFPKKRMLICVSLAILVLIGWFIDIKTTSSATQSIIYFFGHVFNLSNVEYYDKLSLLDGFTNAIAVFSRSVTDCIFIGLAEYLDGFDHGIIGNIIWMFFGGAWLFIKYDFFITIKIIINFFIYGFQRGGGVLYYISYFITASMIGKLIIESYKIIEEAEEYE